MSKASTDDDYQSSSTLAAAPVWVTTARPSASCGTADVALSLIAGGKCCHDTVTGLIGGYLPWSTA